MFILINLLTAWSVAESFTRLRRSLSLRSAIRQGSVYIVRVAIWLAGAVVCFRNERVRAIRPASLPACQPAERRLRCARVSVTYRQIGYICYYCHGVSLFHTWPRVWRVTSGIKKSDVAVTSVVTVRRRRTREPGLSDWLGLRFSIIQARFYLNFKRRAMIPCQWSSSTSRLWISVHLLGIERAIS